MIVLAQSADALSGLSGWGGAGLLGLVLAWLLLTHLPAKDKQLQTLVDANSAAIAAKDQQLAAIIDRKWEMIRSMGDQYKESLAKITEHCEKENRTITEHLGHEVRQLTAAVQDVAEIVSRFHAHDAKRPNPKETMKGEHGQ